MKVELINSFHVLKRKWIESSLFEKKNTVCLAVSILIGTVFTVCLNLDLPFLIELIIGIILGTAIEFLYLMFQIIKILISYFRD